MIFMRNVISTAFLITIESLCFSYSAKAQSWDELSNQATQALRSQNYTRAIELWAQLMTMKPRDPEDICFVYWSSAAVRGQNTGEMQKAEAEGTEAVQCVDALQPSRTVSAQDVRDFRGEARRIRKNNRRDSGDYSGALADIEEMALLDPTYKSTTLLNRAEVEELRGNIDQALMLLSQAIESAQDTDARSIALTKRAFTLAKVGRLAEAQAELTRALEAKPFVVGRDGDKQADFYAATGRYDLAADAYKRDEDAGTAQSAAYAYLRSFVEAARGDFSKAAVAIRKAEVQQADKVGVLVAGYLARARAGQTDTSSLAAAAGRFTENKWPDAAIFFVLGKIDADQLLARAAFGNPRIERSRLALANLYIGEMALISGDRDKARSALAKAAIYCDEDSVAQACLWPKGELGRM